MNILFVNNFFNIFSKADCGASQRSMCLIRSLAKIAHVDVVSFVKDTVSNEPNVDVVFSQEICSNYPKISRIEKLFKLFRIYDINSLYEESVQKSEIVRKFILDKKYDYIVTRYLHFACECGLLKYKERLIVDIDDDPKDVLLMSLDKIKTFRNKIYTFFYANYVDKMTRRIIRSIHFAFYSTPTKHYANAQLLPNISAYNKSLSPADFSGEERNILVVGRYHYFPNAEGLEYFLHKIYPRVKIKIPNASLYIVGNIFDDMLRRKCEEVDGVKTLGFVEDLRSVYAKCHCAIVPLYRGTGTSVKLMESMTLGRAVVTTPIGARGLHPQIIPNQDYILAKDDISFAEGIITLLSNEKINKMMSHSACEKIRKYYSVDAFDEVVAKAVK